MNITIPQGPRSGCMEVPASKSQAHRLLICAALSKQDSVIRCGGLSDDILATARCLNALGADIQRTEEGFFRIVPMNTENISVSDPEVADDRVSAGRTEPVLLECGESGSTLRFLIPLAGALGKTVQFIMEGRLSERPLRELTDVCSAHGMTFEKEKNRLLVSGKLNAGSFRIDGRISSQYITGLLFALPILSGNSTLTVTGGTESSEYIRLTEDALHRSGIRLEQSTEGTDRCYRIDGNQAYDSEKEIRIEKDWSGAAFPLCAGAFSENGITVEGMNTSSVQGDKKILPILSAFGAVEKKTDTAVTVKKGTLSGQTIDAAEIPDLIPVICAVAAVSKGTTVIQNAGRLRLKESDRIKSTAAMLRALGGEVRETDDGLIITGKEFLSGGTVDSFGDHRIAMSAAVAAGACTGPVTILDAECTDKSYPGFWEAYRKLEVIK